MRTKRTLLAFATSCLAFFSQAQDIHFSQINETPLLINPANAGLGCDMRAILNYRTQWSSVTTPYKTFAASYEVKLLKKSRKGTWGWAFTRLTIRPAPLTCRPRSSRWPFQA